MADRIRPARLASLVVLGLMGPAFAHAHLTLARPAMGEIVATPPAEIDLAFSEALNLGFCGVTVTGPGDRVVPLGEARLRGEGARTLVVPVGGPLSPGLYRVEWHALAADGHKTTGSYAFTVAP